MFNYPKFNLEAELPCVNAPDRVVTVENIAKIINSKDESGTVLCEQLFKLANALPARNQLWIFTTMFDTLLPPYKEPMKDEEQTRFIDAGRVGSFPVRQPKSICDFVSLYDMADAGFDTVHENKFLLCQPIWPAVFSDSVCTVVSDLMGGEAVLTLHNFADCRHVDFMSYLPTLLPPHKFILVAHPWLVLHRYNKRLVVQCFNPSYVRVLEPDDPIVAMRFDYCMAPDNLSMIEHRVLGKQYFADKLYQQAIAEYTTEIDKDPRDPLLLASRSMCYIRARQFQLALDDAERGLLLDPSNPKLVHRKAKSLALQGRCLEAAEFLRNAERKHGKNKALTALMEQTEMLRREQRGQYDMKRMLEEARQDLYLDEHIDYIAPVFCVQPVPQKGRGLVATEDIPAYTLLMACKAVAYAPTKVDEWKMYDFSQMHASLLSQASLMLTKDPQLPHKVYDLCTGCEENVPPRDDCPVDLARLVQIWNYNLIEAKIFCKGRVGYGLWLMPAYLNHTCTDVNCIKTFIGDFIFIRTARRIKKDEELLVASTSHSPPYLRTEKHLKGWYDCKCSLCAAELTYSKQVTLQVNKNYHMLSRVTNDGILPEMTIKQLHELRNQCPIFEPDDSLNLLKVLIDQLITTMLVARNHPKELVAEQLPKLLNGLLKCRPDTAVETLHKYVSVIKNNPEFTSKFLAQLQKLFEKQYGPLELMEY